MPLMQIVRSWLSHITFPRRKPIIKSPIGAFMLIQPVNHVTDELTEAFQRLLPQLTTNHPPPTRAELEALVAFAGSTLVVARESESAPIIGAATLSLLRTPTGVHARLEDVIVDEAARGQGVGEAL